MLKAIAVFLAVAIGSVMAAVAALVLFVEIQAMRGVNPLQ